eukprot:jgi/Botrbrau1/3192/Bobra.37_2s0022.1
MPTPFRRAIMAANLILLLACTLWSGLNAQVALPNTQQQPNLAAAAADEVLMHPDQTLLSPNPQSVSPDPSTEGANPQVLSLDQAALSPSQAMEFLDETKPSSDQAMVPGDARVLSPEQAMPDPDQAMFLPDQGPQPPQQLPEPSEPAQGAMQGTRDALDSSIEDVDWDRLPPKEIDIDPAKERWMVSGEADPSKPGALHVTEAPMRPYAIVNFQAEALKPRTKPSEPLVKVEIPEPKDEELLQGRNAIVGTDRGPPPLFSSLPDNEAAHSNSSLPNQHSAGSREASVRGGWVVLGNTDKDNADSGMGWSAPSDMGLCAGSGYVLQIVNTAAKVFEASTGKLLSGPVNLN